MLFHHHLRRTKIHFSVVTLLLIVMMSTGAVYLSNVFHQNPTYFYFTKDYLQKNITYFEYKYEIERKNVGAVQAFFSLLKPAYKSEAVHAEGEKNKLIALPVLAYHGIIQKPDGHNVLEKNFKDQLFTLKSHGYQTVTLQEAYEFLQGKKDLPNKSFLITFDDGRKDSYYAGDPILKATGFTAVNSVITAHSTSEAENHYYLTLGELKQMLGTQRWEIQSHSYKGHDYTTVDAAGTQGSFFTSKAWITNENRQETEAEFTNRIRTDLETAKQQLQEKLGIHAIAFAFPFGEYGQRDTNFQNAQDTVLSVVKSIYPLAFYQVRSEPFPERRNYPTADPFLIRRVEVSSDWTGEDLLHFLESTEDKTLPFEDDLSHDRGWIQLWGGLQYTPGTVSFFASPSTTGALSILDGGYLWTDYTMQAQAEMESGQTHTLVARYHSSGNYVACKFGKNHITLEEYSNNVSHQLAIAKENFFSVFPTQAELGIQVHGTTAACLFNKRTIVKSEDLHPRLQRGTIGFTVWDATAGVSALNIYKIHIEPIF